MTNRNEYSVSDWAIENVQDFLDGRAEMPDEKDAADATRSLIQRMYAHGEAGNASVAEGIRATLAGLFARMGWRQE